jgi:spore germination protein GerM
VQGCVAVVDLEAAVSDLPADRQLLAVAQVVCALTSQPGVGQVRFTLDGERIDVPREDGALTGSPVTREDYADLIVS